MTGKEDIKERYSSLLLLSAWILVIGFVVNLIWENAQAFLYIGYGGFWPHFWICFIASVVDAVVILLVYLVLALIYKDLYWPRHNSYIRYTFVGLIGAALAVGFEKWALKTGEWDYTDSMPLVPVLEVGLSPLLQLVLLPVLTYYVSLLLLKQLEERKKFS